jgi:CheY-like chemotaxis protein
LAIVKELAVRMDGHVVVESEPNRGSLFTVNLLLAVDPQHAELGAGDLLEASPQRVELVTTPSDHALKVLVCEDNPVNRKLLGSMLQKLGHEATMVADGAEGWERLQSEKFDLMITDIEMPRMNGVELSRKIRAVEAHVGGRRIPIVAATAHVGDEAKSELLDAGIDAYLPKPFTLADIQKAVLAALQ